MGNVPAALLRGLLSAVALSSVALTAQSSPNFLILVADDVGADVVGMYGAGPLLAPTPTLDRMATLGVRFTDAHVNPACSPTRAALMTGRYAFRTGVPCTVPPLAPGIDPAERLLPRALAPAGYTSALIGKWHLGYSSGLLTPNALGWNHFAGNMEGGIPDFYNWPKVTNGVAATSTRYATTDQVDDALSWIGAQGGPWLLMLSFNAPHQPLHAPPAHLHSQNLAGLSPATSPLPFFRADVEAMDREMGRLLTSIPAAVMANTVVIALGDNGTDSAVTAAATGSLRSKGSLYGKGAHVPLVITGPGVTGPGRAVTTPVSGVDLFPTVLELAGVPLPGAGAARPLDGVSLVPLLHGTQTRVRDHVFVEINPSPFGGGYAVRTDRWELLRFLANGRQRQELYDRLVDPGELNDLLLQPPALVAPILAPLEATLAQIRTDGWVAGYGAGCSTPGMQLRAENMPTMGGIFVMRVVDPPPGTGLVVARAGWSRTSIGAAALPLSMSPVGMPGCDLLTSAELPVAVDRPSLMMGAAVPNVPGLFGLRCYVQAFAWVAGAGQTSGSASNALQVVVGR